MTHQFDLVIFGGTGDLSLRKLIPAMFRANYQGSLGDDARIIVCTRKADEAENMQSIISDALQRFVEPEELTQSRIDNFLSLIFPQLLDLVNLENGWGEFSAQFSGREDISRIFYLAVAPSIYGQVCENLSQQNLVTPNARIVVEKPIGYDLMSAEKINETMAKYFQEEQIYRIDHYLGKETVQNLLALRFSNFLFENIWDSKSIDHIQISICEQVGLEGRAGFYDGAGAMRDMVQNHLLQLLCLIAMESPNKLEPEDVRVEKIKVLKALKPILPDQMNKCVVRGQYVSGQVNDEKVAGYLDELGDFESKTETFVAIKTFIENWRWAGVPFYLRTGKRLKRRSAEIIVEFKSVTHDIYAPLGQKLKPNRLVIQLQPEEKIQMILMAKAIGSDETNLKPIKLNLDFISQENAHKSSAYQRLLLDAIAGNPTLFIHRDEVKAAWRWVDPIIENWKESNRSPELYNAGSWGPSRADDLFEDRSQYWIDIYAE
ncbi:glucose-6-phosphate dehydrogenase [Aliikangiella sp. G2MR2-5]|uniref:glucose-6-phosphate dehydrogenase n=1 Tax=Aliikangiella sp. G2MR2-5 TaxID=2788943 RepID=UPI0018AB9E47|nr:glucose-6-phosphate dehydrogenase [Aliikangiella sp. G2MR2-5]